MIRQIIVLCICLCALITNKVQCQEYFNKHFRLGDFSTTPINILPYHNKFLISYLNGDLNNNLQSGFIIYNTDSHSIINNENPASRIAKDGIFLRNDTLLVYGKNTAISDNLFLKTIDITSGGTLDSINYKSVLDIGFPFGGANNSQSIFGSYSDDSLSTNHREFGIFKVDYSGNLKWQRNFNQNYSNSNLDDIQIFNKDTIVTGGTRYNSNTNENFAQILKIDPQGILVTEIISEEEVNQSTTDARLSVIGLDLVIQAYQVSRPTSNPIRLDFYDSDLNLKYDRLLPSGFNREITSYDLHTGNGDYFFVYGSFYRIVEEKNYGYLTKLDLNGDVLWQHIYQHPDFPDQFVDYRIVDLIEEENGDINCLGSIFPLVSQQEIWLFKINEKGCLGDDSCDEVVITDVEDIESFIKGIELYPNPTDNIVNVISKNTIKELKVYDMEGRLLLTTQNSKSVNVSPLESGIYILHIHFEDGRKSIKKIIRK